MAHIQLPKKLEPLFQPARYKIAYGGRGGTKSWGFARALLTLGRHRSIRVLCARETQRSIRDSVHRLLSDQIVSLEFTDHYEILKSEIKGVNGTIFLFAGLSSLTVDSIKSFEGADICWVEEGQSLTKRSWSILIPTIRKAGSEIWVSFNPDLDTDDTYVRFIENTPPGTVLIPISWQDNPWLTAEMRMEMDHLKRTDPIEYENVWEGKCRAAAQGAIYTREMQALAESDRVGNVPSDPLLKTHAVWDLGFNDQTAIILVQTNRSELRIIDYIEESHYNMVHYGAQLKAMPLNWGTDYIPWDGAQERFQLTDPANSPQGILQKQGRRVEIVPKCDVETGIKRARLIFPRCYFDKNKTVRLRECLKRYKRIIPATTDEPSNPCHDEFSHGADAFRYLGLVADQLRNDDVFRKKIIYPKQGYA